jgi:hypothetical protein
MSNESNEILSGLQAIENLIAELNTITLNHSFSWILSNINRLKSTILPDIIIESDVFNELEAELKSIENSAFKTCLFIIEQEVALCKIPSEFIKEFRKNNSEPTLEQLNPLLQKFKELAKARNESCLNQLMLFKSELSVDIDKKPILNKINEINLCIEKLKLDLIKLSVQQDEIENLLTRPRLKSPIKSPNCPSLSIMGEKEMKEIEQIEFGNSPTKAADIEKLLTSSKLKIKSKIGIFSTSSIFGKEEVIEIELRNSLTKAYENFINTIDQYKKPTFNKNELNERCNMDHLIILNKASLNKIEEQISQLIINMTTSWYEKFRAFQTEEHQSLNDQLKETIVKLDDLNKQKNEIKESILARQEYLMPAKKTSTNELQISLDMDKKRLRETLESFFKEFIEIKFTPSKDKNNLFVIAKLKEFIKVINNNFEKKYMPFNKDKLSDFYEILQWHLGDKPLITYKVKPKIDEAINLFLQETFESPSDSTSYIKTQEEILKNQIIVVRSFTDQIKLFSISEIKNTYLLKNLLEEQEHTLAQNTMNLSTFTTNLVNKLNKGITRLVNTYQSNDLITSSYKAVSNLVRFDNNITKMHEKYVLDKVELGKISSAFEFLVQITNLQKQYLADLQKLTEEIENPNGSHVIGLNFSKNLSTSYNQEKDLIISQLTTAIADAKAALKIFKTPQEVETLVAIETKKIEEIKLFKSKIFILENEIIKHIDKLEAHIYTTRQRLKVEKGLILTEIEENFKNLQKPLLHSINPFTSILDDDKDLVLKKLDLARVSYLLLGSCAPTQLQLHVNNHDEAVQNVNPAIKAWTDTVTAAQLIEDRLISEEYLTSQGIIKTLSDEYLRISEKSIHKALENFKDLNADLIKNAPLEFLGLDNLSEENINFLNVIDPRLYKLWSIRNEFQQINKDYINTNLNFKALASARQINQLKKEYLQILKENLDNAMEDNPDNRLIQIKTNPNILFTNPELINDYQEILDIIDPDLYDLCKKIQQSVAPKTSTKELYVNLLLQKVETHLHNDQMEHFSDYKRSAFVQFVRIYVIKPLQVLKHKICSFFGEENSKHCFFTTACATKTEAALVEKGNEAVERLAASAV